MHRPALYLFFLITLFIMPPPAYAQKAAINAPAKPAEGLRASGGPALSGPAALKDMLVRGLVRPADMDDTRQYLAARAKIEGLPDHLFSGDLGSKWYPRERTFMVLSPDFIVPRGLRDDYKFIVPSGQPEPKGPRTQARVYSYDAPKSAPPIAAACKFPGLPEGLPAGARVFAFEAENYNRPAKVEVQIDPSVTTSDLMTITVNSPDRPAIILLRSHEATIWHFNWTRGSQIAAVFINGQYRQAVSGLPESVPVFINDLNDPENSCPSVKISPYLSDLVEFNNLSRHLFKRDIHQLRQIRKNEKEALAGEPLAENSRLESAAELDLEKFRLPPKPLSGRAALRDALARGLIREINQEDIRQYTLAWGQAQGLSDALIENSLGGDPFYMGRGYVVLSPDFVIPDGLYDGYKGADFLVPAGMPELKGPRRYLKVFSFDQLKASPRPPIAETCKIAGLPATPPQGVKVYMLRGSLDEELDFQIKGSSLAASLMEVKVNSPSEPVYLLLRGEGPTIWHFSWTRGSRIAGVFLSSREPQIVSGLPKDVPLLINDFEENSEQCPKIDLYQFFPYILDDNDLARHLFQKSIDKIYSHREKNESGVVVGQPLAEAGHLESAEPLDLHKYRDPDTLMAGRAGLHEAVEKGLIKEASREEVQAYKIAEAKAGGVPDSLIKHLDLTDPELYRCNYMVLSPDFVVPAKMSDVYWLAFYVPEGLGALKGDPQLSGAFGDTPAYRVHSYDQLKLRKKREPIQAGCRFPNSPVKWPAKGKVYALAEERLTGHFPRLDFGYDEGKSKPPKLMKITVNSPDEPAFLMLDAKASTIWHFSWTRGSRIAGLYIEGYGRQIVSGLPPDVPVLINEQKRGSKETDLCPGFSVTTYAGSLAAANDLSRHLFHRNIDEMDAFGNADDFVIGRPLAPGSRLESAEEFDPEKFRVAEVPPPEPVREEAEISPAGPAGLEEALARGWIRKAGPADIKEYLAARAGAEGLPERLIADGFSSEGYAIHRNPYVVLSPDFQIPKQLRGNQSASFIVPEGTPEPEWPGRPGAKAPLRLPDKQNATPYEQMKGEASRIYSYADLKYLRRASREPINCVFPRITTELPAEAKVYALSAASGPELDFALEGSSRPARLMKVGVNSPDEPALLLLQSEGPAIWRFSRTKGSRIAGLFISGQGPQLVSGLPDDVPVLINGRGTAGSCPAIRVSRDLMDLIAANELSHLLFDRSIEKIAEAENGEIVIGRPLPDNSHLGGLFA